MRCESKLKNADSDFIHSDEEINWRKSSSQATAQAGLGPEKVEIRLLALRLTSQVSPSRKPLAGRLVPVCKL